MLIDLFLPEYNFTERHEIMIRASAEEVYAAINSVNLGESWIIWGLFSLRGLGRSSPKTLTLRDMTKEGFAILGEKPNRGSLARISRKILVAVGLFARHKRG
jgi:hypothetical protein